MSAYSRRLLIALGVAILWLWCARVSEVAPGALFDETGRQYAGDLLSGLASPDWTGEFLSRVGRLTVESLAIGFLGTALALLLGIPLAIAAARTPQLPDHRSRSPLRLPTRGLLAVMRSIPEIVWAFLFVRILGLGPR